MKQTWLTRGVWVLSLVSMLADVSSELLYPIMPLFLASVGFDKAAIGLLEGCAEAIAGLSKRWLGAWSDRVGARKPLVVAGYCMSALARPLMSMWPVTGFIFSMRFIDRLGKGTRSAARDALLAAEGPKEVRGRIFGFHRSFDTLGAAIGPILAIFWLQNHPNDYIGLLRASVIPGLLAVGLALLIQEKRVETPKVDKQATVGFSFSFWTKASSQYKQLVILLGIFALANSSDMLLLLRLKEAGLSTSALLWSYVSFNAVAALTGTYFGFLSDRFGPKKILLFGILVFNIVYALSGMQLPLWAYLLLLPLYGLYSASTDGQTKAWISQLCPSHQWGAAFGFAGMIQSLMAIPAGLLLGFLWQQYGAGVAFSAAAGLSVLAFLGLSVFISDRRNV